MDWKWLNRDLGRPPWLYRFHGYVMYFSSAIFSCLAIGLLWLGEEQFFRFVMAPVCALVAALHYFYARGDMKEADRRTVSSRAPDPDAPSESN
jgi:hypothetical protein